MIGTSELAESFEVVYNLAEVADGLFIPNAYIVSRDRGGLLAHIKQKAAPDTIGHFRLDLDEVRKVLFALIDEVQVKSLEAKFSPPRKKEKPLEDLLQDEVVQKQIYAFVHRKVGKLLEYVVQYRLPLTLNVDRRVLVKDFLVELSSEILQPDLSFKRTPQGVTYRLRLRRGDLVWRVSSREVIPITNNPAWVLMDNTLYQVAFINGNMVKPFRKQDELRIPNASVKTYFQKFIIKVATRLDIDADGFQIRHYDQLRACRLQLNQDFFVRQQTLMAYMEYPHAEFDWKYSKQERTTLEFNGDEIGINKVRRRPEEEKRYIDQLKELGLAEQENGQFALVEAGEDPLRLIHWVINNQEALEARGFIIAPIQIDDKAVYLRAGEVHLNTSQGMDWFDVHGEVIVGDFKIPFLALARNIRNEDRFYLLPDGSYFLIPLEWMEKYKSLVQFARKEGEHLRLNKSQYPILQGLGISEEGPIILVPEAFSISPLLKANLRPYQLEGARWLVQLYENDLGACLADDMGLGKTVQTLAALLHAKDQKKAQAEAIANRQQSAAVPQLDLFAAPAQDENFLLPLHALIVLPASLVFNWEREIRKFAPTLTVYLHVGTKRHQDIRLLRRFDIVLTTYQTALRDVDLLRELEYEYIVLDESQQIKNRESKVFRAINQLKGRHKISLSGTPIENSLSDLWAQMQFINPDLLGSYAFFQKEFITPIEKRKDEDKKTRLSKLVAPYLKRRTKEEVAQDLPALSTQVFYSEMTPDQKKLYEKEKSAARNYLLENFDANSPQYRILVLQSLTKLRQVCNHPRMAFPDYQKDSGKFNDVLEHWEVIRKSNHKALFFSSFVQYLELFKADFESHQQPYSILTGSMSSNDRDKNVKQFEEDPAVQSFLISIKAGGVGLNLTAADYVFILDPWWNPTTEQQAISRAHRIGQSKNVIAVKFITKDSIEEKILQLQSRKFQLAEDILGNVRTADFTKGDIEYLLE